MPTDDVIARAPSTVDRRTRGRHRRTHRADDPREEDIPARGLGSGPGADRGQTTVLVAMVVGVGLLLAVGLAQLGRAVVGRAQARTVADAAALAAVVEEPSGPGAGRRAADAVAARNGAVVVGYRVEAGAVEVEVRIGDAARLARAERVLDDGG